ncbi:hypothetical protein [Candidatus Sororendozoicomonas aggregata]|uniref:hypothetical protein n=1 Tax=Candidatus Sororendozoicomonas aggregata TaxID=3073239 RepID=UPI002ED05961
MKGVISAGFRLTALASFGFWWAWLIGGAAYYYFVEQASLWSSLTSGAGISLFAAVCGVFSALFSEVVSKK